MSSGPARLSILANDEFACIRIAGRANLHSSIDFKAVVNELKERGCPRFILDLSDCSLMDSTFLGVLAGFGLRMGDTPSTKKIELLNANARITGLLESLGVLHLFHMTRGSPAVAADHCTDHVPGAPTKAELGQTCIEAHETLMRIDPANVARFKDVARFLAEDLRRQT